MKEAVKSFKTEVSTDPKKAEAMIPTVYKAIDKAAKKGVIKPNTADRKKAAVARALKSE
jgi:ribosomal protein S20